MAKKVGEEPGAEPGAIVPAVEAVRTASAIFTEEQVQEAGPDAVIRVLRIHDVKKKPELHGRLSVDEQSEERVGEIWGGGTYIAQLVGTSENGKVGAVIYQRTFALPGRYKPPQELYGVGEKSKDGAAAPAAVAAPTSQPGADLQLLEMHRAAVAQMYQNMQEQQKLFSAMIAKFLNVEKPTPAGPTLGELAALITALKPDPQPDALELLAKLRMLDPPKPATPLAEVTAAISQMLKIRDQLGGAAPEPEDAMTAAIKTFGPPVAAALTSATKQGAIPRRRLIPSRPGNGVRAMDPVRQFAPLIPQLVEAAQNGRDFEDYAHELASGVTPAQREPLQQIVGAPDFVDRFFKHFPETLPWRAWHVSLLQSFMSKIGGGEIPASAPGPAAPPAPTGPTL